ncbi:MAG: hypothetical protein V1650_02095 [Candidatus Omnitrophota bacterium]
MEKNIYLLIPVLFLISGCAPLIVGAAVGGVGAYAISRDTIQGQTDKSYESLWNAALVVARIRGTIKQEDYPHGRINLEVDSSRVEVNLIRLTLATTTLKISARKYHLPNINLAQELYLKIIEEAK